MVFLKCLHNKKFQNTLTYVGGVHTVAYTHLYHLLSFRSSLCICSLGNHGNFPKSMQSVGTKIRPSFALYMHRDERKLRKR